MCEEVYRWQIEDLEKEISSLKNDLYDQKTQITELKSRLEEHLQKHICIAKDKVDGEHNSI